MITNSLKKNISYCKRKVSVVATNILIYKLPLHALMEISSRFINAKLKIFLLKIHIYNTYLVDIMNWVDFFLKLNHFKLNDTLKLMNNATTKIAASNEIGLKRKIVIPA